MKNFRRILMALLCVVGANSLPANAGIISAGTQIFNLDFTANLPYSTAQVSFSASPFDLAAGQTFSLFVFPDFNAVGTGVEFLNVPGPIHIGNLDAALGDTAADFLDGQFSVRLMLNTGSLAFTSLTASVLDAADAPIATQTLTPRAAVPEPATLALLGLAIAGIGFSRRKRR